MKNTINLSRKYTLLMVLISTEAGCVSGFASVYLESHGFSNIIVGFLLAFGNMGGAILSPILGSLIDKSKKINVFNCLISIFIGKIFLETQLLMLKENPYIVSIVFCILMILSTSAVPIVTDLCFVIDPKNKSIDYGFSRGCGSLAYAGITLTIGFVCMYLSADVLPILELIVAILQISVLLSMLRNKGTYIERNSGFEGESLSLIEFIIHNKKFMFFSFGLMLLNFSACVPSIFLINVVKGFDGKVSDVGIITSVAAFAEVPIMLLYSRIVRRISSAYIIKTASIMYVVKASMYVIASNVKALYFVSLLQAVSYAPLAPAIVEYSKNVVNSRDIAKSQTVIAGIFTFGNVFASQVGGILFDVTNVRSTLEYALFASIFGSILCFLSIEKYQNIIQR